MPNKDIPNESKLPVSLKDVNKNYKKPEKRNELVPNEKYEKIDSDVGDLVKLGTNGVVYVAEDAFPTLFQTTRPKGGYIFENQIPETDRRTQDGKDYAHSSSVVGLLDKKSQEVRDTEKQAALQYARDSLINISDSDQAQTMRRMVDSFTKKNLPKLRKERGKKYDEVTGERPKKGFAFHHINPKELHTDPEDVLNPSKGINVNLNNHNDIHRKNINDENQLKEYIEKRNNEPENEE
ncbi:hypothetical protein HPQ32_16040 [Photobacterium carnosum]|uniref:hypothetical protein n=1 Tax=Photobacterium carnosum TaxID=2023717 RepID=UPI001C90C7B8|nr:hypothetical protein [Photobacterium carnosum]MBY3789929.1 hypothetical protein [Photobacterium carnosum]MCD9534984.1 hypothetical protein [Photobacterium carnosum]